jgi:hypothetical protein
MLGTERTKKHKKKTAKKMSAEELAVKKMTTDEPIVKTVDEERHAANCKQSVLNISTGVGCFLCGDKLALKSGSVHCIEQIFNKKAYTLVGCSKHKFTCDIGNLKAAAEEEEHTPESHARIEGKVFAYIESGRGCFICGKKLYKDPVLVSKYTVNGESFILVGCPEHNGK